MNKIKKRYIYLLAFLIPIGIFFIVSLISGYVPFFDEVYQIFDARHQYPGFFIELKSRLASDSIFYSLNGGLGFNFLGTITYYLMSPLNLLLPLFNAESLTYFYLVVIYLHFGLAGLTMSIYLNNQEEREPIWVIVFSVVFALMGYLSCYYYNYMWISSIVMLPLIMLGIDKIVDGKKCYFYIISLALGIIFNYYIGVMLCIFSIIYFLYKLLTKENVNYKKVIINFIISSICSGLLSAFVLIPTFFALIIGKAKIYGSSWIKYFEFNINNLAIFYKLTPASFQTTEQAFGPAMVYTTIYAVIAVIMFFYNKGFRKKEKIIVACILAFFYFSFSYNLLDYGWQLFQKPIWWQSRYSFTFSTFLIIIAFKSTLKMDQINIDVKKKLRLILISIIIVVASAFYSFMFISNYSHQTATTFFIIISCILICYYVLLYGNKSLKLFFITLIGLELSLNLFNNLNKNDFNNSAKDIKNKISEYQNPLNHIKAIDDSFYRLEFMDLNTTNDGMLFDYHGINYFNSSRNQNAIDFLEYKLGVNVDSGCGVKLKDYNPALMSLLNIKYLIGEIDYYDKLIDNFDKSIYQNKYPLSLGFMVNDKVLDTKLYNSGLEVSIDSIYNSFLNQDESFFKFIDRLSYINEFDNVEKISLTFGTNYKVIDKNLPGFVTMNYLSDSNYLLYGEDLFKDSSIISINNVRYNMNIGKFIHLKKGDKLKVTYTATEGNMVSDSDFKFDLFDLNLYEKNIKKLSTNLWDVKENDGHLVSGSIVSTKEKNIFFTSIPYEEGFEITVDGKKVKPIKVFDTFVGLELTEGTNFITVDYFPKGLNIGLIVSSGTLIIFVGYYIIKRKKVGQS